MGTATGDDEIELIDVDLDWNSPAAAGATSASERSPRGRSLRDPRWLILVAVVAYVGWILSTGAGSGDGEAAEPDAPVAPTTTAAPAETVTIDDDRIALIGDPTIDLAAAIEEVTPLNYDTAYLEMQVNPDGVDVFAVVKGFSTVPGDFRFGYLGVDGRPVVIDTDAGEWRSVLEETVLEPADLPNASAPFDVLADAAGTIGFDPDLSTSVWRVASDSSIVRRHTGELFGVRETPAGVEYGPVGDPSAWSTLPAGADVWIEPSVGVFLTPASGGVFELTPAGAELVTPFEMVSTNGTRWVEIRRVVGPDEFWVVDRSGDEWMIDRDVIDVGGELSISPDGQWIFVAAGLVDSEFPAFWGVETGEIIEVESRADRRTPVWAPDSTFVAELDPTRNCIWINFISGLNGCIVLDKLNVPALEASALVIY